AVTAATGALAGQTGGGPPTHAPPAHASAVVQALPSLHAAVLGVLTQPEAGLQLSSVQALPSLQFGAAPPTQTPPAQVSAVVQALRTLHGAGFGGFRQPPAGSQRSSGRGLPRSPLRAGPPAQTQPAEVSAV